VDISIKTTVLPNIQALAAETISASAIGVSIFVLSTGLNLLYNSSTKTPGEAFQEPIKERIA
jgi:hypothetical protein